MPILAALLTLALAAESTPPAAPAAAPAAAAPAKDPDKLICRKGVNQTGSRMRQRPVCMTRREWEERARLDKELMGAIQRGGTASTREPGTPQ